MNEKLKEPRIYLCAAVLITLFLPWISINASASFMGASADSSSTFTGIQLLQQTFISILIFIIPIALIILELIPTIDLPMKLLYLIAPILSIVISIVSMFLCKSASTVSAVSGGDGFKTSLHIKFGFILALLLFVAIIAYTLINDFALNKDTLGQKGLKGAISDIAGEVSVGISDTVKNANFELPKSACPQCGAPVTIGKKFCTKCGYKIQPAVSTQSSPKKSVSRTSAPITVQQYIDSLTSSLASVKCTKCNCDVPANTRFCPQCGEKVVIAVYPENCESCGKQLIKGKKYCPDCGALVNKVKLISKCTNCGSELYFGKKYCPDCGAKVQ